MKTINVVKRYHRRRFSARKAFKPKKANKSNKLPNQTLNSYVALTNQVATSLISSNHCEPGRDWFNFQGGKTSQPAQT